MLMKKVFGLLTVVVLLGTTLPAGAAVVTFDDLEGSHTHIPAGYGGFDWSDNFYYLDGSGSSYTGTGYDIGAVSSPRVAFSAYESAVAVTAADPFDFNGAYFTGAWNDGLSIDISGWLDGSLLHSTTVTVNTTAPTWVGLNWTGVDELRFDSYGGTPNPDIAGKGSGTHFVMDNFTYNGTPSVPVPGAVLLGSLGAGLVSWLRRRRSL